MARRYEVSDDDSPRNATRRKRKFKRRYVFGFVFLTGSLLLLAIAPTVVASKTVLMPLIDRYGGLAPLKVDFDRVNAGWFTPAGIEGLRVTDGNGQPVVKVGAIQTEKGVFSWILNSSNLGTIRVRDVEVDVAVAGGTTSIEQAIAPLTAGESKPADNSASSTSYTGNLELSNARVTLRDNKHADTWIVTVPSFKTQLPGPGQIVGPTQLTASIADGSGANGGTIAADVAESQNDGTRSFNLRAVADRVPLGFWHVLHERLPDVPVDELAGSITARIAGSLVDDSRWNFNIEQLSGDQLVVTAPSLVGAKPARLESVKLQGQAQLAGGSLVLNGTQLTTDVGGVSASGTMPWPIAMPSLTQPWLPGAQLNAEGAIDLAKLAKVAETLVPMREDTRLVSGQATFKASQQATPGSQPSSKVELVLGNLLAVAAGQQLKWDDALKLSVSAQPQAGGQVALSGVCNAEFCQLVASGTPTDGSIKGQVNLDRLQQRLSQWIDVPVTTMTGNADLDMRWSQSQAGLIVAEGQLNTTPLVIAMKTGGELREPAWKGAFTATAKLNGSQLSSIERGHMELIADSEQLKIDLLEPLSIVAQATPAAFTISSEGALESWMKRAVMLKLLDSSTTIAGKYALGASGRIDMTHMELLQANWRSQPFEVGASGTSLVEPEMVGNFQGRVDTNDLTRLAIEKLTVQAHSFSLSAADSAAASGDGTRNGTGAYIVDVGTLMRNIKSAAPPTGKQLVLPPGMGTPAAAPQSQLAFAGQVNGSLRWQVNSKAASLEMDAKSDQVDVIQQTAGAQPTRLWSEAQIMAIVKAGWDAATGNVQVSDMQLKAPWMHYAGTMALENKPLAGGKSEQIIRANGQCLYDAGMVATKLQPYIGNNVQLSGRKTVPVEVMLTMGGPSTATSMLAGLQAATRIGWEQARVVGIEVGTADVPVRVNGGQLTTNAEIPVSGGTLRWDVQSDLTQTQTVLIQKPMTVLENVAITPQMCESWLKFVTPLLAQATSVDGRLSLKLNEARFNVANPRDQIVDGQLIIHSAVVGPGPLSNQVIGLVQQINAIRKKELGSTVGNQQVWMQMPQQSIAFRMENGRVIHRDLRFHVGDVNLVSSGAVDIDGRMELNTQMPIPDDWIEKTPLLASFRGQSLQFPVRGSLTSPQLDSQFLRDFGRQAVTQAAEGLIQQQLSKGLGKLFGPGGAPTASGSAGAGSTQTGLPQLGLPQLGLPQFGLPQSGSTQPATPQPGPTP